MTFSKTSGQWGGGGGGEEVREEERRRRVGRRRGGGSSPLLWQLKVSHVVKAEVDEL